MSTSPEPSAFASVGYATGADSPVFVSTTSSDFRKSSTLSAGTDRVSVSPGTRAVRSK